MTAAARQATRRRRTPRAAPAALARRAARPRPVRSLVPVVLALVAGGLLLLALGATRSTFYANVWRHGVPARALAGQRDHAWRRCC